MKLGRGHWDGGTGRGVHLTGSPVLIPSIYPCLRPPPPLTCRLPRCRNHLLGNITKEELQVYESEFGGSIRQVEQMSFLKDIHLLVFMDDGAISS